MKTIVHKSYIFLNAPCNGMQSIPNAIQVRKYGCHFRSRLEARWAQFFTTCGIKWEYEKEGFRTTGYDKDEYYLPDFYLSDTDTWVEVKGDPYGLCKSWERMTKLLDWGGVLPNFAESFKSEGHGLLLLGAIPEGRDDTYYVHPIIQHHQGIIKNWCYFDLVGTLDFDLPRDIRIAPVEGLETSGDGWMVETKEFAREPNPYYPSDAHIGYRAARSARFEHGESGAT